MANILLSCWGYSRYHKHVLPVTGFWQFDRVVESKVGFNPPIHFAWSLGSIWFLRRRTSNIIPHTRSEARYFSDYNCYPIRNFGGGDWLEGCHFERMKIQWSGTLVSRTKYVMMTLEWRERKPANTEISKLQDGRVTGNSVCLYVIIIKIK